MLIHLDLLAHKTGLVIDTPAVFACDALEIVSDRDGAMKFREHLRCTEWWSLHPRYATGQEIEPWPTCPMQVDISYLHFF